MKKKGVKRKYSKATIAQRDVLRSETFVMTPLLWAVVVVALLLFVFLFVASFINLSFYQGKILGVGALLGAILLYVYFGFSQQSFWRGWLFVKQSRREIYAGLGIFLFFVLVGAFLSGVIDAFFSYFGLSLNETIILFLEQIVLQTEGMGVFELTSFIFLNNVQSSFTMVLFGFVLGIFPLFGAVSNGYLVGFVSLLGVQSGGVGILWRLLPHGIFELPAIFVSIGLGFRLGLHLFRSKKEYPFRKLLLNSLRAFLFIVLPLLVIAAIIEGLLITLSS